MTVYTNPIYSEVFNPTIKDYYNSKEVFSENIEAIKKEWLKFETTHEHFSKDLSELEVDFSITTKIIEELSDFSKIRYYALRILLFPLGLYELTKHVLQRFVMIFLYPAQSSIMQNLFTPFGVFFQLEDLDEIRKGIKQKLNNTLDPTHKNYIVRQVILEKNGKRFSGLLIFNINHKSMNDKKWVIHASGNCTPIETIIEKVPYYYHQQGYNLLFVNGPGVGRSMGPAIPETMGDAQEVGIRFLEEVIKANKIVLSGTSLGGAAMGKAILDHEFKTDIKYLAIRKVTFDRSPNACAEFFGKIFPSLKGLVRFVVNWTGLNIDSVEASKKLQSLGIKEIIVQAAKRDIPKNETPSVDDFADDLIITAEASLARALIDEGITENKRFIAIKGLKHIDNMIFHQGLDDPFFEE